MFHVHCTCICRYASLDENRLRFDVQCQYQQIEQAYQKPSSLPSKPLARTRKPVLDVAPNSTDKSKYAVPGLSPHLQVCKNFVRGSPISLCIEL